MLVPSPVPLQAMVELTNDMVTSEWGEGGVRDVYADFNKLTLDIVVASLFGYSNTRIDTKGRQDNGGAAYSRASDSNGSRNSGGSSGSSSSSGAESDLLEVGEAISVAFDFFARRATSMLFS